MKLMNKLLPFATLGCVAAVVTPLATSCGNNGFYSFDGSKFYVPSSDLAEMDKEHKDSGLPYTEKEATELYYKNIANNSDIFVEDLLFYLSSSMYEEKINAQQWGYSLNEKLNIKYENVSVDKNKYTISYDVKLNGRISFDWLSNGSAGDLVNSLEINNLEASIKNVPYVCEYDHGSMFNEDWEIWHGYFNGDNTEIDNSPISEIMIKPQYDSYNINVSGKIDGTYIVGDDVIIFDNLEVSADKKNISSLSNKEKAAISLFDNFGYIYSSYHLRCIKGIDN